MSDEICGRCGRRKTAPTEHPGACGCETWKEYMKRMESRIRIPDLPSVEQAGRAISAELDAERAEEGSTDES